MEQQDHVEWPGVSAPGGGANDNCGVIDVMVLYTPAALASAGDEAAMEALIHMAISVTNLSMVDSDVNPRFSPVHIDVIDYTEAGTVDPDADEYDGYGPAEVSELRTLLEDSRDAPRTRNRLWNRVREPIARALQTFGGMTLDGVKERADIAAAVTATSGLDWERGFLTPAVEAIPDPASWSRI